MKDFTESKKKMVHYLTRENMAFELLWNVPYQDRFILMCLVTSNGIRIYQIWPDGKGFTEWKQVPKNINKDFGGVSSEAAGDDLQGCTPADAPG